MMLSSHAVWIGCSSPNLQLLQLVSQSLLLSPLSALQCKQTYLQNWGKAPHAKESRLARVACLLQLGTFLMANTASNEKGHAQQGLWQDQGPA